MIELHHPGMSSVVRSDAELDQVATGFGFTEGPVWHWTAGFLLFSDMPGDRIRRWAPAEGVSTFRSPSQMANGNAYDHLGRLVTCEHQSSRVTRTEPDGTVVSLAECYHGQQLNSPNDVIIAEDASIYFTDPTFGRLAYVGVPRDPELSVHGVYRIRPDDGGLDLLVEDFAQPNGLCFSLDEQILFVNDTARRHIRAFPVLPDRTLGAGQVWARLEGPGEGGPDGMKIDSAGNLYCAGPGGIHVFAPDATCLGVIKIPEVTANFTWGEHDLRTLLICASTSLYRIRVEIPGRASF